MGGVSHEIRGLRNAWEQLLRKHHLGKWNDIYGRYFDFFEFQGRRMIEKAIGAGLSWVYVRRMTPRISR